MFPETTGRTLEEVLLIPHKGHCEINADGGAL